MSELTTKRNRYEIDMCNGSIMDKLISFSIPLMLSGILQLLFNAVDIIVVGRFAGSQALAAVGSTTALINVFTNLFIGVSLGANVLAAWFYASGRKKEMSETVHTSILFALLSGIVMVFVGLFFSRAALELMDTPADVIDQSALYMQIYFAGMPFFMLYNYGAAILRAVGDTKRPLFFLVIAGVINAGLNLFLVIVLHLGVAGPDDFLYSGAAVSVSVDRELSASDFQIDAEMDVFETDFSGGDSGRHSEYSNQFFQCAFAVFRKFFWLGGNGRLYGGK